MDKHIQRKRLINKMKSLGQKKQYTMFDLEITDNDIWYFKNVISYPEELINFLNDLDNYKETFDIISKWNDWFSSDKNMCYGDKKTLNDLNFYNKDVNTLLYKKTLYIVNSLKMAFEMCWEKYAKSFNIDLNNYKLSFNNLMIKRYFENVGMGEHKDFYSDDKDYINKSYTLVLYLNNNYEGGNLYFKEINKSIKPEAGSLVIFPAEKTHESLPTISGRKIFSQITLDFNK